MSSARSGQVGAGRTSRRAARATRYPVHFCSTEAMHAYSLVCYSVHVKWGSDAHAALQHTCTCRLTLMINVVSLCRGASCGCVHAVSHVACA